MRNDPIKLHQPELVIAGCGDALASLALWARKSNRIRNIVPVPLLPDEMSRANDQRRLARRITAK